MNSIRGVKNLANKKVLVRVDFNIPLKGNKVVSDYKLVKGLPTIEFLQRSGAVVILVSHLGRPKGRESKLSLKPVAKRLGELTQEPIGFYNHEKKSDWEKIKKDLTKAKPGTVMMLENIRFLKGEEAESTELSKILASICDLFVLDGFAVSHRRAASVTGVAKYVPSYAGLLLFEEVSVLSDVVKRPKHPLVVILGGAKAETKIPVLKKLLGVADHILVGGGIFNTYLASKGYKMGKSLVSLSHKNEVRKYCQNRKVILPLDVVVGNENGKAARVFPVDDLKISKTEAIYDIGPSSVKLFASYIKNAKTLVWNGAMGMFEQSPYQYGTYSLVRLFAARSRGKAFGVCGGGETVEILEKLKVMPEIDLVSTGGGAMLEYLSGAKLPGLEALK